MTVLQLQENLREVLETASVSLYGGAPDHIACEVPPKTELGDLAFPAAFELAKLLKVRSGEKQNPRAIAAALKSVLEEQEGVERVDVAGPGYLNVFFDRARIIFDACGGESAAAGDTAREKVCVEHTSVNPNKAAHIGHVRNSVLGDSFQRILSATGRRVEIQNYIDNTGVQVADVVVGFLFVLGMDLAAIEVLDARLSDEGTRFDHFCWDLYARVGQEYVSDEGLKERRTEVLHAIEAGTGPIAEAAEFVATRNVECILATMERLSIRYDLLPRESEILHLHFWDKAFEHMKSLGVIHFETEGKNAGCWVMPFDSHTGTGDHESDKILVRSNGTVTYTGKDIAYQMWKLGILGMDFFYRPFHTYADGRTVWITTAEGGTERHPPFGGGETVYNVIDSRQSYPQEIVKKGVAAIVPEKGERASVHLSYEMVALSPAAAEELGFQLSHEDRGRPFIEMSGRKGLGVKADDLIDRLEANALSEVEARETERSERDPEHAPLSREQKLRIAHQVAVGALRYFLLKFTRNTVIVFDFKEALSLEGETGVFCQYSAVRANSIFRKLEAAGDDALGGFRERLKDTQSVRQVLGGDGGDDVWAMLMLALRLEDTVRQAALQAEPAILAKYTFTLAKAFNLFYKNHKILPEKDASRRAVLIATADAARRSLTAALEMLGIEVPEKM